jgi:hypothetical protein
MNFKKNFLLLWVIFALLGPDPDSKSGSSDPIESGSGSATLWSTAMNCCRLQKQLCEEVEDERERLAGRCEQLEGEADRALTLRQGC